MLHARRERPCRNRASKKREKLAPLQLTELHSLLLARVSE
jgi:hypothetical protein